MIKRHLSEKIKSFATQFPIVAVLGPRQSGKTTLVRNSFPDLDYLNVEEPDTRLFAESDPRAFLANHPHGLIIDEVQRVPHLFSYLQSFVDQKILREPVILTGSQHFLLHEKISQTLAGRVALFTLLPFSTGELSAAGTDTSDFNTFLFKGFYPPLYDRNLSPVDWMPGYIQTYVERDVRLLKNITNLSSFNLFLKMCAGRIGQLLNLSALANELGVALNTIKAWISVLEAGFIIFRLQPYYRNFNKRLVKMPKLYFYDTGLAAALLGITDVRQIHTHWQKGALFENLVIIELIKLRLNKGLRPEFYFWRDKLGREIDCVFEKDQHLIAVEIKSGMSVTNNFWANLRYWQKLTGEPGQNCFLVYGGDQSQNRSEGRVLPWHCVHELDEQLD